MDNFFYTDDDLVYDEFNTETVCIVHKSFVPCRKKIGCVTSTKKKDVDIVRYYQSGDWH